MVPVYFVLRGLIDLGFSQSHTIGNIDIIANLLFPYHCSFLTYLMLVNVMSVDIRALYFKIADFIDLVLFRWYSYNNGSNISIVVLWRGSGKKWFEFKLTDLEL